MLDTAGRGTLAATPDLGTRVASVAEFDVPGVTPVFARLVPGDLRTVAELAEAGMLKVRVARTFPLEQAAEAQRALADGHAPGRIVLLP
ncbi:zinc-binding dehydrogenase [Amycolatopsis sp., V23-08]|uniref:Zinc-binding dehydrogenase n=1 Tax=Amycolatopsis heterodermiae TaxID=3110235 RepID=A0ABU5RCH6_9PSEU|nr:zinc-binding dehydrogenase [Amycolatopsis sp., V23-08]MEA5363843.1 zinc-binding dehydrogenase [Amycolatopsis sp., V23-08]